MISDAVDRSNSAIRVPNPAAFQHVQLAKMYFLTIDPRSDAAGPAIPGRNGARHARGPQFQDVSGNTHEPFSQSFLVTLVYLFRFPPNRGRRAMKKLSFAVRCHQFPHSRARSTCDYFADMSSAASVFDDRDNGFRVRDRNAADEKGNFYTDFRCVTCGRNHGASHGRGRVGERKRKPIRPATRHSTSRPKRSGVGTRSAQ